MEYGDTKAEASRIVAAAGLTGELETTLICPTAIIGPWDFHGGLFTKMIGTIPQKGIPATIPGGFDFVDVRDVAGAALAAVERGRSGRILPDFRGVPEHRRFSLPAGGNQRIEFPPSDTAIMAGRRGRGDQRVLEQAHREWKCPSPADR